MCVFAFAKAQDKKLTKTATIEFKASVPSFEPIEAVNKSSTVVLDGKGNLASLVLIKGFKFPIALMQEHFNENYIESDKFPKAILKGSLENYKAVSSGSSATFTFNGSIEMHGVTKKLSFPVKIANTSSGLEINSAFSVKPDDFKIAIPGVVRNKIAQDISITVAGTLN